jgi:hypothetical protein
MKRTGLASLPGSANQPGSANLRRAVTALGQLVRRRPRTIAGAVLLIGLLSLAGYGMASAATQPVQILSGAHTYFSPNGDGHQDTQEIHYCLSESSNITITVSDSADHIIRSLEDGVSHSVGCYYYNSNYVTWDGKNDAGTTVPDGVYTVKIHAVTASGDASDDHVDVGVDSRRPGVLTSPKPNDTIDGPLTWVFTPTPGFSPTSVEVDCSGSALGSVSSPQADGTFTNTAPTTGCLSGANQLSTYVYWTDAFGSSHSWSGPAVPVTIDNAPTLSIPSYSHKYFSPNGDGQEDSIRILYCLSKDTKVAFAVRNASGDTVYHEPAADRSMGSCYYTWNNESDWDGKTDAGDVAPMPAAGRQRPRSNWASTAAIQAGSPLPRRTRPCAAI